jgi:hypothetical protein
MVKNKFRPSGSGAMRTVTFAISKSILLEVNNDKKCMDILKAE